MQKLLLALLSLAFPGIVHAVDVSLSNYPTSVADEEFSVTVTVAGASSGTNYLRLDLYQEGTTSYFGETDNGTYWYGGSDGKLYAPLSIASSSAELVLHARLGEPTLAQYPGPGTYKMRVRRYTSSGNQASNDTQTPVTITLTKTWPSPTPTPPPPPSPTPTPSPSPTPSPTPTPTPTPHSPPPTPPPSPSPLDIDRVGTVAGEATEISLAGYGGSPPPSPPPSVQPDSSLTLRRDRLLPLIYIGSGLVLIALASYLAYRQYRQSRTIEQ